MTKRVFECLGIPMGKAEAVKGSFLKILAVAQYEALTLWRSWFFRIFGGVLLALVAVVNALVFGAGQINVWTVKAIPADIPYLTMLLVNLVQSVVAVILASDFMKRDRSLDTTDVVYVRSISNTAYVIGKACGNLFVFACLDFAAVLVAGLFNFFSGGVPVNWAAYVYYPLFIGIPTLAFCIGYSFVVMSLFLSQPLALLVLLGSLGMAFFFLQDTLFSIFDFAALRAPLMVSDFTGFGSLLGAAALRCAYLLLGVAFVLITGLRLKRLPQSETVQRAALVAAVLAIGAAGVIGALFVGGNLRNQRMRSEITEQHNRYFGVPNVRVTHDNLSLVHQGKIIRATAKLIVCNPGEQPLAEYVLRLNPGLVVRRVDGGRAASFRRSLDLLFVKPSAALPPGSQDTVRVSYEGSINDAACYLDIARDDVQKSATVFFLHRRPRFSFINDRFLLLTPETGFYPRAGAGFSPAHPECDDADLSQFTVSVSTSPGLSVLCQGASPGNTTFAPGEPLPGVSVVAGPYRQPVMRVDSVEYSLFTLANHDYYKPFFRDLPADSVASLIRTLRADFESRIKISYPFQRFRLVEVPLEFTDFPRLWTAGHEAIQPEMALLPENGFALADADFGHARPDYGNRGQQAQETQTPFERESALFQRFVASTFARDNDGRQILLRPQDRNSPTAWALQWLPPVAAQAANLFVFPEYVSYACAVHAPQCPLFGVALESYFRKRAGGAFGGMARMFSSGASTDEKVNLLLQGASFGDICKDEGNRPVLRDVVQALCDYLMADLQRNIPAQSFDGYLQDLLAASRFKTMDFASVCADVKQRFGFDLAPAALACYRKHALPGYIVDNVAASEVLDKSANRYLVRFEVQNPESAEGLIKVSVRTGSFGGGRFGGGGPGSNRGGGTEERMIAFAPRQSKEIGVMMDNPPRTLAINTFISRNIPATITYGFDRVDFDKDGRPFEGERVIDSLRASEANTVIVDDQDSGFAVETRPASRALDRIFGRAGARERYAGARFFDPPVDWTQVAGPLYYGKYVRSAYYVKAGVGGKRIAWNATLKEQGTYEVFAYYNSAGFRQGFGRRGGQDAVKGSFHYLVHHDDGVSEVPLDLRDIQNGWNLLGRYHCSAGTSTVELTDKGDGMAFVMGDAVKWVKQR